MSDTYQNRRSEIGDYFDRTAADAWKRLSSDAPVSRIRQTVRAGREEMRRTLLSYLPKDLKGVRVLDAGCGTGALAQELAHRGADVVVSNGQYIVKPTSKPYEFQTVRKVSKTGYALLVPSRLALANHSS